MVCHHSIHIEDYQFMGTLKDYFFVIRKISWKLI